MKVLHESAQVHNIDFLPPRYHDEYARRKTQAWRILIVVAFAAALPTASLYQYRMKLNIQQKLYQIGQQHRESEIDAARLVAVHSELAEATAAAELWTYVRHPWPATQLLAALVRPLPDSITLKQITIARPASGNRAGERAGPTQTEESSEPQIPAAQDLQTLKNQTRGHVVVKLVGLTSNSGQLHRYLAALSDDPIFARARLESVESESGDGKPDATARFEAVVAVQPAYGQPGGPVRKTDAVAADIQPAEEASDRS